MEPDTTGESPADGGEASGGWTLVGIFAGAWLLGGFFKPKSAFAEKDESSIAEKAAQQL